MPKRDAPVDLVAIPPADPLPRQNAGVGEITQDLLHTALRDPYGDRDVPQPRLRIAR